MAVGIVGMTIIDIVRGKLIKQLGLSCCEVLRQVKVPHKGNAARTPTTTAISLGPGLGLTASRVGAAGFPKILRVNQGTIDVDVVDGMIELSGVARVVGTILGIAPVVS